MIGSDGINDESDKTSPAAPEQKLRCEAQGIIMSYCSQHQQNHVATLFLVVLPP